MLQGVKHTARLFAIGLTLARYDALFGLKALGVSPTIVSLCHWLAARKNAKVRPGIRLARALQALGPTFIKLGQTLSTRPDLLGEEIARDLSQLQDRLPPFSSEEAKKIVESEFNTPITELFDQFDDAPIAAASIAQVHFATTKEGKDVAVKVLRPDIEKAFTKDIELMMWLAEITERRAPSLRRLKPVESVRTFEQAVHMELDLRYEAAAAAELKNNMKGLSGFYVPAVSWHHTSERVLTTERIKGISINDIDALKEANINLSKLVEYASNAFFHQVFYDGFFHADMHPGNLFALPDGRLAAVDFGIMGRIDRKSQIYLAEILWGFLQEDYYKVAKMHIDAGYVPKDQSIEHFAQACRAIAQPILDKPLNEISIAKLLGQLFQVAETFKMEAQPQLLMLQKTMMLAEGVGRSLSPDVNMWKLAEPLVAEWAKENLSPNARIKESMQEGLESLQKLPIIVKQVEDILDEVNRVNLTSCFANVRNLKIPRETHKNWLIFLWSALLLLTVVVIIEFSIFFME